MNVCKDCIHELGGICFNSMRGIGCKDNQIHVCFFDKRKPADVTFDSVGQLKNYLQCYMYLISFEKEFTRKQLRQMLMLLFPYMAEQNDRAFRSMCKRRMVAHIRFYMDTHLPSKRE